MTHAYNQLIRVEHQPWHLNDAVKPTAFYWRGERYDISHVNEPWHLMDKWWEPVPETWQGGAGQSDRMYYRVVARGQGHHYEVVAEIYHDLAQKVWVMERIYD